MHICDYLIIISYWSFGHYEISVFTNLFCLKEKIVLQWMWLWTQQSDSWGRRITSFCLSRATLGDLVPLKGEVCLIPLRHHLMLSVCFNVCLLQTIESCMVSFNPSLTIPAPFKWSGITWLYLKLIFYMYAECFMTFVGFVCAFLLYSFLALGVVV